MFTRTIKMFISNDVLYGLMLDTFLKYASVHAVLKGTIFG